MFFVSTVEENDYQILEGGSRGYFNDLESAIDAVYRNVTDIHETIYPYAVIEELEPGLFPIPKKRLWFAWSEEKWGFYETEKPDFANKYPKNFSIAMRAVGKEGYDIAKLCPNNVEDKNANYFISLQDSKNKNYLHCGFFNDRKTAFNVVCENYGNIYNGTYGIALIECITPYILPKTEERVWFKWDNKMGRYCKTYTPKEFIKYPPNFSLILG